MEDVLAVYTRPRDPDCPLVCLDETSILPSLSFPPLEFCRGTRPSHAAKSRPERNMEGSGTCAARAALISPPTPGTPEPQRSPAARPRFPRRSPTNARPPPARRLERYLHLATTGGDWVTVLSELTTTRSRESWPRESNTWDRRWAELVNLVLPDQAATTTP
jgi:hypothetical protein